MRRHCASLRGTALHRTAQRSAEQAVRQSEERLRLAMNASQSGVWDWDLVTGKAFLSDEY